MKAIDYAMMAGIPLAMGAAYKMPEEDDQEAMDKYLAKMDERTDVWRDKYGREFNLGTLSSAQGGRVGYAHGGHERTLRKAALAAMYGDEDEEENTGIKQLFSDTWRAAKGGRIGYQQGAQVDPRMGIPYAENLKINRIQNEMNERV